MGDTNGSTHHIDLYVRSSEDGNSLGACPFCQQMLMIVWLKTDGGHLSYDLHLVDPTRPPMDFRKLANRLPVLKYGDEVVTNNGEIVAYLDTVPGIDLRFDDALANAVCLDVFSRFTYYIRQVSTSPDHLRQELWRINDHYLKGDKLYLCGDDISHLDLLIFPKLHHIRIAAFALKEFVIPKSMVGIWKYLKTAYSTEVFRKTCPSDQEIVYYWTCKADTAQLSDDNKVYYSTDSKPRFTWTTPFDEESNTAIESG